VAKTRPTSEMNGQSPSHLKVQRSVSSSESRKSRRHSDQGDFLFTCCQTSDPNCMQKHRLQEDVVLCSILHEFPGNENLYGKTDTILSVGITLFQVEYQIWHWAFHFISQQTKNSRVDSDWSEFSDRRSIKRLNSLSNHFRDCEKGGDAAMYIMS